MTGPAAMMPMSPAPSPAAGGAKVAGAVKSAESGKGERGGFSDMLFSLGAEADAPEVGTETKRDDTAEPAPPPFGMPIQLQMFPDKPPQLRFAEELSAAAFPADTVAPASPSVGAAPLVTTLGADTAGDALAGSNADALAAPNAGALAPSGAGARAASDARAPAMADVTPPGEPTGTMPPRFTAGRETPNTQSTPPVQPAPPAIANGNAGSAATAGTDPAFALLAEMPVAGAQAEPARGSKERVTAKAAKSDATAPNAPAATMIMDGIEPLAPEPASASTGGRSREEGERDGAARTLAILKDANVSSVQQETHFAPGPQQSPAFQIANRIVQDVKASDPAAEVQPAIPLNEPPAAGPVKVLQLKLDPPDLGGVTIRLSMKNDALHLQIEASRHETARLIERDRDALGGMLRSAGYGGDGLSVQITSSDRGNGSQQFSGGGGFNQPAGQNSAGRQPENSGSGQAWQRALDTDRADEPVRHTETPRAPRSRGGPVYL